MIIVRFGMVNTSFAVLSDRLSERVISLSVVMIGLPAGVSQGINITANMTNLPVVCFFMLIIYHRDGACTIPALGTYPAIAQCVTGPSRVCHLVTEQFERNIIQNRIVESGLVPSVYPLPLLLHLQELQRPAPCDDHGAD